MSETKVCSVCQREKDINEFVRSKKTRSGRLSLCRPCGNERTRRWREAHPEAFRESSKRSQARRDPEKARAYNREHADHRRELDRQYRAKNRARLSEQQRKRRKANPDRERAYKAKAYYQRGGKEKSMAYQRGYRTTHRDYFRLRESMRKAAKRGTSGSVTERDVTRLLNRFHGHCAYCRGAATTLDHVIPLARGGRHTIGNLLPACGACNSSKRDRLPAAWRARRGISPIS